MAKINDKGSSISRRRDALRPHRRPRQVLLRHAAYTYNGLGDWLYWFGTAVERAVKNFFRRCRKSLKHFFARVFRGLKMAGRAVGGAAAGMWDDVTMPFKKMQRSFRSLNKIIKASEARGAKYTRGRIRQFFKYGWLWNKHMVGRLMNYLLPLTALIVCLVVIGSMLNLNFALEVSYNGQTVGYIADEGVYESARKIIQNRMISGDEQTLWTDETELSVAVVDPAAIETQDVMADSLLKASGNQIAKATGLWVGGVFYGATTAPDMLLDQLKEMKAPYDAVAEALGDGSDARWVRKVETKEGVFPSESVLPYNDLINTVASGEPHDQYYTAKQGESAADIAALNGITVQMLEDLNPGIDLDFTEHGAELLVARGEPILRLKTVKIVTETQSVAFETIKTVDGRFTADRYFITQYGQAGERTITKEVEYDANGDIVSEIVISDEITTPPINQEVIVGTGGTSGGTGTGILAWPTGTYQFISRGWIPNVHSGIDIAAMMGTPVYAAESGTVIESSSSSYGYGECVIVRHSGGIDTLYGHCSVRLVTAGETVQRGQLIALVGSTGNSTGPHLHFEVRMNGVKVPPENWIY